MVRRFATTEKTHNKDNGDAGRDLTVSAISQNRTNETSMMPLNPSTSNSKVAGSGQPTRASFRDLPPLSIPQKCIPQARMPHAITSESSLSSSLGSLSMTSVDDASMLQDTASRSTPAYGSARQYYNGEINVDSTTDLPGFLPNKYLGLHIFDLPSEYTEHDTAKLITDYGVKIVGKIIMREADMGKRWVTVRLQSPKQAKKVRDDLNGKYIGDNYIEVAYEVDSAVGSSSATHHSASSSQSDVSSAVSLSMSNDKQAKGEGLLTKIKRTRPTKTKGVTKTKEVSIGPDEAAWVLIRDIHRDITQVKFEEAMRNLDAIWVPGLDWTCFGRASQNAKVRFISRGEATEAVARLTEEGLDGHPVGAWLSANPVPYLPPP